MTSTTDRPGEGRPGSVARLALHLVPERWRSSVALDLEEEARRAGRRGFPADLWRVRQTLAIAGRMHMARWVSHLSLEGVLTGFVRRDAVAALRHLRRTPVASVVAVLTLSAAVAGVTVVYSVLSHTVLAPLAFPSVDRLVAVYQVDPASPDTWRPVAPGNVADMFRETTVFERLAAARNVSLTFTSFDDGDTPLMRLVSHGWFEMLGVVPVLGRTFTADEDQPNGPHVAMLSEATWRQRFGGDPAIVGRTVELDFVPYTIVGVVPERYENPVFGLVDEPQVWMPLQLPASGADRSFGNHFVAGRLRDGVSLGDAQAELTRLADGLAEAQPDTNGQVQALVTPLDENVVRPVRTPVLFMFGAVLVVFVAACGNVSTLMLARAVGRRQAIAVQQALGAPRLRLVLQVILEHLMLSVAAGLLAVWLAWGVGRSILLLVPEGFLAPRFAFSMDGWTVVFAACATVAAGLLASLPSVVALSKRVESEVMETTIRTVGSRRRRLWFDALIGLEVAGAAVLLLGAGLVAIGFERMQSADAGFDADRAITFRVSTRGAAYVDGARRFEFFERVIDAFSAVPGVRSAGATTVLPVFNQFSEVGAYASDEPAPEAGREPRVALASVTEGLLETLDVPLVAGRLITSEDRATTQPVVVLSQSAASAIFGARDPLHLRVVLAGRTGGQAAEVVGIVGDVRSAMDPTSRTAFVYQPWRQVGAPVALGFVVRTEGRPESMLSSLREALRGVDRQMPLYQPRTLESVEQQIDARGRFAAALLSAFACLGLLLVVSGIYGTLSHLASGRRREMGVRMALGASRRTVLWLVLADALRPAAAGAAVGLLAAVGFGRAAAAAVSGTPAFSLPVFAGLPLLLLLVVAASSLMPARRATRVDPTVALRAD